MSAVVALVIIIILIVWMVVFSSLAVILNNKLFEKLGVIGWIGHAVHRMCNGDSYVSLRKNHFDKLYEKQNNIVSGPTTYTESTKQSGGYDGELYDPDF